VLGVLDEFELKGATRPDLPGVFLGQARVATVGVAVNRWVAYHGLTLNVGPYLVPFELLLEEPGIGGYPPPPDLDGVAPTASDPDAQGA